MRFPVPLSDAEQKLLLRAEALLTRCHNRVSEETALTDPSIAGKMFQMRLGAHEREIFSVAFLDTRHRLIAFEDLHAGTVDGCEVHPRVVVQRALTHNAAAIILGHVHPSGNLEPSAADRALTARLKSAVGLVDIRLLDHFVVGTTGYTSMAARGWV
jgi:DNA repair protein RadC